MKNQKIYKICVCALFSALIGCMSLLSIPTPFGINLTMQIFGCCLAGFCLGAKGGTASVAAYIVVGAAGLPVFSSFTGGIGVLLGPSGGFLLGFLFTALFCGFSTKFDKKTIKISLCILSVLLCHIVGIIQYSIVTGVSVWIAALTASLPFLLKDFMILFLALYISQKIKNKIKG